MTFDVELLKLLGATFALVVSTVTVQFKIADFVNRKGTSSPRDGRAGCPASVNGMTGGGDIFLESRSR